MAEMFDLDALESEGTPFRFRFGGEDYEFPADLDFALIDLIGNLDDDPTKVDISVLTRLARRLFGSEQWARVEASDASFGVVKLIGLMNAYQKHLGVSLGELQASTGSSKSTVRPSKRTSNGSTGSRSRRSAGGSRGGASAS